MPGSRGPYLRKVWRRRLIFICLLLIVGCAQPGGDTTAAQHESVTAGKVSDQLSAQTRIMIKFSSSILDPSAPAYVAGLSRDAGAALVYVRPMSGGTHVFVVEGMSSPDALTAAIKRLAQRSDVVYVEPDRIMRHQKRE